MKISSVKGDHGLTTSRLWIVKANRPPHCEGATLNKDTKVVLLKDEYLLLQKFYEDFDARIIKIKGWSATIGLAAIGAGFYQTRYLWLFAAGAAIVFWAIEALWKSFQYMYAPRIELLEEAFREDSFEQIAPFQVYSAWFETFQATGFQLFANMRLAIVCFPHVITLVAGVVLFVLEAYGVLSFSREHQL